MMLVLDQSTQAATLSSVDCGIFKIPHVHANTCNSRFQVCIMGQVVAMAMSLFFSRNGSDIMNAFFGLPFHPDSCLS